ncbi:MAG: SCO family protein [Melioribacteraceae bacterium]|nr:SCO family protein [Melioribacteraceae bacterium]
MRKKQLFLISLFILLILVLINQCRPDLPVETDFSGDSFALIDQDSNEVSFPGNFKGKLTVLGYIFTNCPDICPLTTNNMRLVQERLKKQDVQDINFVTISFDPDVDKPSVLKKFAELRNLDLSNWIFLTGDKDVIKNLIKKAGVFAIPNDTSRTPAGEEIIYFVHTDRISLMDGEGRVRKNYYGSKINIDEIVDDIIKF